MFKYYKQATKIEAFKKSIEDVLLEKRLLTNKIKEYKNSRKTNIYAFDYIESFGAMMKEYSIKKNKCTCTIFNLIKNKTKYKTTKEIEVIQYILETELNKKYDLIETFPYIIDGKATLERSKIEKTINKMINYFIKMTIK